MLFLFLIKEGDVVKKVQHWDHWLPCSRSLALSLSVYSEICFQIYPPEDTSSIAFFAVVHTVSGLLRLTHRSELWTVEDG